MESSNTLTTITIYPLFSNHVMLENLLKYATDNLLTVTSYQTLKQNSDGTLSSNIVVSQTLTSGQKTAISTIFQGTAYITFV